MYYLSRWSKARPSTSWIATVGPESARGPWSIARKTGLAADKIDLCPGNLQVSGCGPTRKVTSLSASLSNKEFHLKKVKLFYYVSYDKILITDFDSYKLKENKKNWP